MLPIAMLTLDVISSAQRGYADFDVKVQYNPILQVSNLMSFGGTLVLSSFEQRDSDTKSDSED